MSKINRVILLLKRIIIYGFVGAIVGATLGWIIGYAWEEYWYGIPWMDALFEWLDGLATQAGGLWVYEYLAMVGGIIFALIGVALAIIQTWKETRVT